MCGCRSNLASILAVPLLLWMRSRDDRIAQEKADAMGWLTPSTMRRKPGTPGVSIILADVSESISPVNKRRIIDEVTPILARNPRSRLIAFAYRPFDITHDPSLLTMPLWECRMGEGDPHPGGIGTFIGRALAMAAQYAPERTIILSDGATADKAEMFRVADSMTGAIDAYFCAPKRDEYMLENYFATPDQMFSTYTTGIDKSVMQELARRSGGSFEVYPTTRGIYADYGIRDAQPMAYERKIFHTGPSVNIQAPQGEVHRVVKRIDVYHDTEIHNHHGETREFTHGEPEKIAIEASRAQVSVSRPDGYHIEHHEAPEPPRGLLKTLLLGPGRSSYRGELKEASAAPIASDQPMQIAYFSKLPTKVR